MRLHHRRLLGVLVLMPLVFALAPAEARHSWGKYHWSKGEGELVLRVGNNVSGTWTTALGVAVDDWDSSAVLALSEVQGASGGNCSPTSGQIEVCNAAYGRNGWLGIAQIWVSGGHISQAVAKMNDSYFAAEPYNTTPWRQLVMCQEIAHDFGLDHQDERFNNANLGTCMDYTNNPVGNEHPNAHDYEQLLTIYGHAHSGDGGGSGPPGRNRAEAAGGNSQAEWGHAVSTDGEGRPDLFEQHLGNGVRLFTHVFWTLEARGGDTPDHHHE